MERCKSGTRGKPMKKKIIIGLTGLIASGKTETAKIFGKAGFTVIDVDSFAHDLYKKSRPLYRALVRKYGSGILGAGGRINRKELAQHAFSGIKEYLTFSKLVFPYLNRGLHSKIQNLKSKIVVLDMAVLFESGFYRHVDVIIFVKVSGGIWKKRVNAGKNSGWTKKTLKYQKIFAINKKIALSDYILYNDKDKADLRRRAAVLIKIIKDIYGRK
jgi:dephospho-CoA kinase